MEKEKLVVRHRIRIRPPRVVEALQDHKLKRENPSNVPPQMLARIEHNIGSRMLPEVKIQKYI